MPISTEQLVSEIFQYTDENGNVLEAARPHDMCGLSKIIDVVKRGRTGEKKAQAYINSLQWKVWDEYKQSIADYDSAVERIDAANLANAENPDYELQTYPVKPVLGSVPDLTVADVLALPEVVAAIKERQKGQRTVEIDNITVEVDSMVFDGDEVSQNRMTRAITALQAANQASTNWKLSNNDFAVVTVSQLAQALALAGQKQTDVWQQYG